MGKRISRVVSIITSTLSLSSIPTSFRHFPLVAPTADTDPFLPTTLGHSAYSSTVQSRDTADDTLERTSTLAGEGIGIRSYTLSKDRLSLHSEKQRQ